MFKRVLAVALAVALVAALWIIPATVSAEGLSDKRIADFDFSESSWADKVGASLNGGQPAGYKYDDGIKMTVADVTGQELKIKTNPLARSLTEFTVEMYVNISSAANAETHSLAAITNDYTGIFEENGKALFRANGVAIADSKAFPRDAWVHIVGVRSASTISFYIDGKLVGQEDAKNQDGPGGSTDSCYIGHWGGDGTFTSLTMNMANFRMYKAAASAADVAALYAARPGAPVATAEPTAAPTAAPLPELPAGEAFKVVADKIPAFKAGDKVSMKLNITDISSADGIMGITLVLPYNANLLEYDAAATADLWNAKSENKLPLVDAGWFQEARTEVYDEVPVVVINLTTDELDLVAKADGDLWAQVVFTAKADSPAEGGMIAYTSEVGGTEAASLSEVNGTGAYISADAAIVPTEAPTSVPTDAPATDAPTATPEGPDVPPTFDAGIISLAAVALSSVVAVKKRKNS